MSNAQGSGEVTCERYLAYFDIMGFKDRVYREPHGSVESLLDDVIKHMTTNLVYETSYGETIKGPVEWVIFSDSIILYTQDAEILSLGELVCSASYFLFSCLTKGIPMKGAISKGIFTADSDNSKYVGRPLVDAVLLAEEVSFYGAVFHHSAETSANELLECDDVDVLQHFKRSKVHMKDGCITHYHLVWPGYFIDHLGNNPTTGLDLLYATASGKPRKYVDNTADIYWPQERNA